MSKIIITNEVMPDPNEVKPDAANELGEYSKSNKIAATALIGAVIVAAIVILAIILAM